MRWQKKKRWMVNNKTGKQSLVAFLNRSWAFLKLLEMFTVTLQQLVLYLHFFSYGILYVYIHFHFMHLASDKINTLYTTSWLFLLAKQRGRKEKRISKLHNFNFFFLARVLCGILKGFREEANQRHASCIARKSPISAAIRSDIHPKQWMHHYIQTDHHFP